MREEGSLREGLLAKERQQREEGKKGQGKGTKLKDGDAKRKVLATTVARSVTLHANVRRKKQEAMQVPVVEVVYIA